MKKWLILLITIALIFIAGCGASESIPTENTEQEESEMFNGNFNIQEPSEFLNGGASDFDYSKEEPLFALVKTQDAAEKIASDYGIELVVFSSGVATYYTDKDLSELIRWGKEQGFAPLEINYTSYAD